MTRYSNSPPDPSSAGKESIPASSPGTDTIFSEALSTQEVEQAVYHAAENDLSLLGLFKQSVPFSPLTGDRAQAILSHHFRRASVEEMNLLISCTDVQTIREWASDYIDFIIIRDTLLTTEGDEFLQEEQSKSPVDQVLKDLLNDFRKL